MIPFNDLQSNENQTILNCENQENNRKTNK